MINDQIPIAKPQVLIVGAGLAGMIAAHYLAEWGVQAHLVDSAPHIGGAFLLLDHAFTTDSCGLCIALPRQPSYCPTLSSALHPRITALPSTVLVALEEEPDRVVAEHGPGPGASAGRGFVATLRQGPRSVDPDRCDNCGACAAVCPATRPLTSETRFSGESLVSPQKAIYPPPPRAIPCAYTIDLASCTRCGACVDICPHGAIDLEARPKEARIEVDAVLLAPGFAVFDAARAAEYGWGRCLNVVTSLEFERMLNRSGPTGGHVLRPSDGRPPRRIAFVHCVGSRNAALGRPYCSTSCCMITAKQVHIAKQAMPEARVTVFTMDVRTAGKGYERYFQRVTAMPGVTYRRATPAAVQELPGSRNLRLLTPDGEEEFDLVVLAVGLGPADDVRGLAACAGVALDEYGFILPGDGGPCTTSRPGVFAAGSGLAPVDVPETVTQAIAAAALIAGTIPLAPSSVAPAGACPERSRRDNEEREGLVDQPPRGGLFLCTCRGALEGPLDFPALSDAGERLRAVVHVQRLELACAERGLSAIERAVEAHNLNRVVVAGCSPRFHANRFDALMARLGLPARLLARANTREGAAWVHQEDAVAATAVARRELQMAVAGLRETPYHPFRPCLQETVARRVLVLGGGLAGMTAALTLADLGVACDLAEWEAQLGGNLRESRRTLEGLDAQALLADLVGRVQRAQQVRVWTQAQLAAWSGAQGDFTAQVRVNDKVLSERYGALVVATGAQPAAPTDYLYGRHPRVVTQRELEQWLASSPQPAPTLQLPVPGLQRRDDPVRWIPRRDPPLLLPRLLRPRAEERAGPQEPQS